MKICTIVGARPQFIKAAVLSRAFAATKDMQEIIIHTGQHYDTNMSAQFFEELDIPKPSYNLNIGSSSHGKQTGQMLIEVEAVLIKEQPDWVLVYGDTNSTLAGALAAAKLHIPVAHVEAGLRSFNKNMPEEINRITTDHLSTLLFAPTEKSYIRLLEEGIEQSRVHKVGDVMYDAALYYNELNANRETRVNQLDLERGSYILATIHRAENTDNNLRITNICNALIELAKHQEVILPLHPRTYSNLDKLGLLTELKKRINLIEPVGYLDMLALEQHARFIVTDSGGVQKEAYFNKIQCITLRNETEWVELLESGWNVLCSPDRAFSLIEFLYSAEKKVCTDFVKLYGEGNSAQEIIRLLKDYEGNPELNK